MVRQSRTITTRTTFGAAGCPHPEGTRRLPKPLPREDFVSALQPSRNTSYRHYSYVIMPSIMTTDMLNLYDLALPDLEALLQGWGQPAYRAKQIYRQLYIHLATDLLAMTDLPLAL